MVESQWNSTTTLDEYKSAIEEFTEKLLAPYTARLVQLPSKDRPSKELNDPVWGTVTLSALEVLILDSPLLQRLRRIRQLGVAHWVYPGTNHTRIEHSMGVCHQVGRLVDSALSHAEDLKRAHELVELVNIKQTLRLAGLCHDVGHGVFSHAIENALTTNDRINQIRQQFSREHNRERPQLSEMAAFYMVSSPAFAAMLNAAREACQLASSKSQHIDAANIIAGLRVNNGMPLLHELISGPFDADKMDYMRRDALMCGIPVVTDIERLVQKTRAVSLPGSELPARIQGGVLGAEGDRYIMMGVARSGARAIDELALGRTLMFDKVYRHHKVRAAESMVASVVELVGPDIESRPELLPLAVDDDEFVRVIANLSVPEGDETETNRVRAAQDLVRRLQERDLFARAIAFTHRSTFDEEADSDERRFHNSTLTNALRKQDSRSAFLDGVAAEVEYIASLIGRKADLAGLVGGVRPYLWVDPPKSDEAAKPGAEIHAHLIGENQKIIEVSRSNPDLRGWADAYSNTRDIGYVFAPREVVALVYVAAEAVLRREYQVRVPETMKDYAKSDSQAIREIRDALVASGYYEGALRTLAPDPEVFEVVGHSGRLRAIRDRLQGYLGPAQSPGERSDDEASAFHGSAVRDWVKQFPAALAPAALKVVEGVRMITRREVGDAVRARMETLGVSTASVSPLGDRKDGASIIAYYAGDLEGDGVQVRNLHEAITAVDTVILVDDFIGRGDSAVSIIEALLGEKNRTTNLNEERPTTLEPQVRGALKLREIHFVFVYGLDAGRQRLLERATELGLNVTVHVHHPEGDIPTVDKVLHDDDLRVPFEVEARRVGHQLITSEEDEERKKAEREFGYGNMGILLISPFNTPTVTLTALSHSGRVDEWDWAALFPRRKKN